MALDALRSCGAGVRPSLAGVAVRIAASSVGPCRARTTRCYSTRRGLTVGARVAAFVPFVGRIFALRTLSTAILVTYVASGCAPRASSGTSTGNGSCRAAVTKVLAHVWLVVPNWAVVTEPLAHVWLVCSSGTVAASDLDTVPTLGASTTPAPTPAGVGATGTVQRECISSFGSIAPGRVHVATTASGIRVVTASGACIASRGCARVPSLRTVGTAVTPLVVRVSTLARVAATSCSA
jgi:hypothetical protein